MCIILEKELDVEASKPDERLGKKENEFKDDILYQPILKTGKGFYIVFALLSLVVLFAAVAYFGQFKYGLGVTGLTALSFGAFTLPTLYSLSESAMQAHSSQPYSVSPKRNGAVRSPAPLRLSLFWCSFLV